jgi:FtsP/CotA-like multicopper oxidase with cupredoxin domain
MRRMMCAVALLAAGLVVAATSSGASHGGPPTTAQMEQGMRSGLPLADPPVLRGSHLRLTAEVSRFSVAGRMVWGESYDGRYVAPTLQLYPGENLRLTLTNRLPVMTNLHFHGMHVSPTGAADNPFIQVLPGQSFNYRVTIPSDHPQGTFWYHDHGMVMDAMPGMSMPGMSPTKTVGTDVESQIYAGLSGTILVGDDRDLLPARLRHIAAHTLILKDVQINAQDHIVQNTAADSIDSNAATVRLVNGELRPVLTMRPGETQLWRIANEGADIFYRLQLDGYRFTVIGEDGYPSARITTQSTLVMPPARRFDVLVTAGPHPGGGWLRTLAYSNGPQGDQYPEARLMALRVAGAPVRPMAQLAGGLPTAPAELSQASIAQQRTVTLAEDPSGTSFSINGAPFSPDSSVFSTPAVLNTVEQWTLVNTTGEVHPFHVHTTHFQVMSINGVPQPYTGEVDTIPVPNAQNGVPGQVVIRVPFTEYTGRWMFHCHIAAHEDNGMMSYINVVRAR